MKKITKLRIINSWLLIVTILILLSGIQLEILHCSASVWIGLHIGVGILFFAFIWWHVYLHYGWSNWFSRFHKQKNFVTKILWWLGILTLFTGLVAMVHWASGGGHTPVGGVHGKIGFLMIIFVIGHVARRIKFYRFKFRK